MPRKTFGDKISRERKWKINLAPYEGKSLRSWKDWKIRKGLPKWAC